jgi:cytochrome c-type biogenesis protein CcmH
VIRAVLIIGAVALLLPAPASANAAEPRASLPDVEDEVMCTICGTLLAESASPQADRERALIRNLIAQGKDKDQIKDALVDEYGPRVLATPSGHGFDLLAWLVPGAVLAAGLVAGILAVRRGLRARGERRADRDTPEPSRADLDELERDMSRYDL